LHGSERKNINTHAFDVLMPGQLWAGAYPHYNPDFQLKLCSDLLALGITNFVDLTTATDFNSRHPYQEPLALAGQQTSLEVEYIHFPLGFRRAPTRRQMSALLELIQSRLNAGQKIYLHAGHNLEGCAPLVLACLLVNQGVAPQDALRRVSDFWLKTLPYLIRLPLTEPQRQFVLNWKKLKEYYL